MFAGDDGTDGHHGLTDYELERVAHIRRNREIMRQLGLGFHDIVTAARARCGEEDGPSEPSEKRRKTDVRLTKTPRATETVEAGIERVLRRSRRLMENTDERRENTDDDPNAAIKKRSKYLADHEIDEVHERDAAAYALRNAGCQAKVSVVGTASYQHTLMRARTMSHPALANRIKAIERAKGKHAVVKMRLFARVLFLEGNEGLADDAAAALARLIDELGDPDARDSPGENEE
jgi:hypothetical protein